jgi:hypothetical protein
MPPIFLQSAVVWAQKYPTEAGFALLGLVAACKFFGWLCRSESPEEATLERLATHALDEFRSKVFPGIPSNVENHLNRVTLFKKVGTVWWMSPRRGWWCWPWGFRCPWSGWLIVIHRSGHVTKNSWVAFLAPNDGAAEGVTGKAFQAGALRVKPSDDLNGEVYVSWGMGLWHQFWHKIGYANTKNADYVRLKWAVHNYARSTHTSPRIVWRRMKAKKVCPTSILGVKVQAASGEPWGVLVMDSANAFECVDTEDQRFKTAWTGLMKSLRKYGALD